jgi:hypothetical protein
MGGGRSEGANSPQSSIPNSFRISEFPAMPKLIFEIRNPNSELKTHLPSAIFADFLIFILILILFLFLIKPVALNFRPET